MKRKKKNHYFKKLIILAILLSIIVVSLFLFEKYYLDNPRSEIEKIEIKDKCTLMFNSLINQIKTENNCKTICEQECHSRRKNYVKIEFTTSQTDCNTCNCYCK